MKLYKKEGNIIQILSFPNENAEKGDYLMVEDADAAKALIVQVIDVQFAAVPGVLEELLRTLPDGGEPIQGEDIDPLEIAPHITYIQDASLLICKIRATLENDMISPSSSWLPSRSQSTIKKLSVPMLMKLAKVDGRLPIILGGTKDSSLLTIDASALDGTLNIITGKKGCGKSHLSKLQYVLRQNPRANAQPELQSLLGTVASQRGHGYPCPCTAPAWHVGARVQTHLETTQRSGAPHAGGDGGSHTKLQLQPARP
jgi:hypothetical protein